MARAGAGLQIAGGDPPPPAMTHSTHEDIMWQANLRMNESFEGGPYPERLGQLDCAYYMRTGLCRFGMTCKFNHPPDRKLVIAAARFKGEYPERVGQPECQYYLKIGTCKFGAMCKFHHPKEKVGVGGRVQLNELGYPLRPNEVECAFYLRTGQCKFGSTCKFHHPQPSTVMAQFHGSHVYPSANSPSSSQQSYTGTLSNWTMPSASFMPTPRWQTPSNYTPVILQQGFVPVAGWSAYPGQQSQQQAPTDGQIYDGTHQNEMPNTGATRPFSYHGVSSPMGLYGLQRENIFPERPGEPECQFYMKTGDCKFGAVCRFHHPKERYIPVPDCALSPLGLPLRPGEPLCAFYSRYGICKFGSNCKFDHPIGIFPYGVTSSSSGDVQVQNLIGTASETTQLTLLSQGSTDADAGKLRRSSVSETTAVSIK